MATGSQPVTRTDDVERDQWREQHENLLCMYRAQTELLHERTELLRRTLAYLPSTLGVTKQIRAALPPTNESTDEVHAIQALSGGREVERLAQRSPIGRNAKLNEIIALAMLAANDEEGRGYNLEVVRKHADHAAKLWAQHLAALTVAGEAE
jgi:hypothetical protein